MRTSAKCDLVDETGQNILTFKSFALYLTTDMKFLLVAENLIDPELEKRPVLKRQLDNRNFTAINLVTRQTI